MRLILKFRFYTEMEAWQAGQFAVFSDHYSATQPVHR